MLDETVTKQVSERYARAVTTGEQMCCPTGYNFEDLRSFIPEEVLTVSYGCGTPAGLETVQPGETVLDIGSGGGIDCFEASRSVGPSGHVIGIDMTDEMLAMARKNAPIVATNLGYPSSNIEFRNGMADAMPVEDNSIDLIISNCVINLAPDKRNVFREMYRVIKPGGRFTISDILADQAIPNYMIHDSEKWGDCLSGALTVNEYLGGLEEAGFRGIHQIKFMPWQIIDGIHFLSLTLTGYKPSLTSQNHGVKFGTLCGPFSRVVNEQGQAFERGRPQSIASTPLEMFNRPSSQELFLLSESPVPLLASDSRLVAIFPEDTPCIWKGHFAILTGPFREVADDDQHVYPRGIPVEICSKTLKVLQSARYAHYFTIINRAGEPVSGEEISCAPDGSCC